NVSLQVNKGEIYGFIGLNGAGKTTTIRLLLGMIRPTKGACYIKGKKVDIAHPSIWNKVGFIVETPHAYPELTVRENLEVMQKLRFTTTSFAVSEVIHLVNLTYYADKKVKHLS